VAFEDEVIDWLYQLNESRSADEARAGLAKRLKPTANARSNSRQSQADVRQPTTVASTRSRKMVRNLFSLSKCARLPRSGKKRLA
jgi:hypothetical protein